MKKEIAILDVEIVMDTLECALLIIDELLAYDNKYGKGKFMENRKQQIIEIGKAFGQYKKQLEKEK